MTQSKPQRLFLLDALRVFAIVMMIAYHFVYDLRYFGYVDWNTPLGNGFWQWRTVILTCFIFAMGMSMGIAHGQQRDIQSFLKRLAQIAGCACLITVMSLVMFSASWIYFGILHFIVLGSVLTFALVGRRRLALFIGLAILISFWIGWVPQRWPFMYISGLPSYTEDFVSPFPWFGVAILGLVVGDYLVNSPAVLTRLSKLKIAGRIGGGISLAGKKSLLIYMIHQPILFALFFVVGFLGLAK